MWGFPALVVRNLLSAQSWVMNMFFIIGIHTPWKIKGWDRKIPLMEKQNQLPKHHFQVQAINLPVVYRNLIKPWFDCQMHIYWIFLLRVKFVPKFTQKTYPKAEILHLWKIQVELNTRYHRCVRYAGDMDIFQIPEIIPGERNLEVSKPGRVRFRYILG